MYQAISAVHISGHIYPVLQLKSQDSSVFPYWSEETQKISNKT